MSLENYTLVELRQLAKERAVKNSSKLKKDELIEILSKIPENEEIGSIQNQEIPEEISIAALEEKENTENVVNEMREGYKITNADDQIVEGILEVLPDGYGFLRGENYLSTPRNF